MTLYTQVASNRRKTWLFMLFYGFLLLLLGWVIAWYFGSVDIIYIAAVIVIIQGWISIRYSDNIALGVAHATPMEPKDYPGVYKIVENLTITAGLPMPNLYLIPDMAINAFATGRDPKHSSVAITKGAISSLNDNELAGVLSHELSHIGNEDIKLMGMVMIMAGLIAMISDLFIRNLFWGRRRNEGGNDGGGTLFLMVIAIVLALLAPLAATLIQLAISRKREFMADANGVLLTRYPDGLINALRKIGQLDQPTVEANNATAHMYFSNPLKAGFLANLFSTHPPLEDRIAALQKGSV
jgi:heat shock protein HtpX